MATIDPVTPSRRRRNGVPMSAREATPRHRRARRTPLTWVRGGGLDDAALPAADAAGLRGVLVVPDRAHGDHVAAAHEPRAAADLGRVRQLPRGAPRPAASRSRSRTRSYFALLALLFGYPIPLIAAVLMSEVRRRRGLYSALAYLPVVIPPVVAVLLWKTFYDGEPDRRLQHDPRLGRTSARTPGCSRSRRRCRRSSSSRPGRTPAPR